MSCLDLSRVLELENELKGLMDSCNPLFGFYYERERKENRGKGVQEGGREDTSTSNWRGGYSYHIVSLSIAHQLIGSVVSNARLLINRSPEHGFEFTVDCAWLGRRIP